MLARWGLVVADFRREYQLPTDELARLSMNDFRLLLAGLSGESRFAHAWREKPKRLHDPNAREALKAAARR